MEAQEILDENGVSDEGERQLQNEKEFFPGS